jgi:NADPH:quinone reductase-like Zn-dependent oxidoreductase
MSAGTSVPDVMNAVRLHPPGGVENLRYEEVPTPKPERGEVLVKVHAAAITRDELTWPTDRLPATPSYELSGTVVATGTDTNDFEVGTDVYGMTDFDRDGVASEFAAVRVRELGEKPRSLSHVESAAVPLAALSAMQGLIDRGELSKDERVLIHGGAGGVGGFAVQIARMRGAYVIATASGSRVEEARRLGADEVIDHSKEDFTSIDPVDLVFDTAGGSRLERSPDVLERGGRLISVAEEPPQEVCEARGIEAAWFLVESSQEQLTELANWADEGLLQINVEETFPLSRAGDAFEHIANHGGKGKVVLVVD